jgi:putative FmdB family regulatory protein
MPTYQFECENGHRYEILQPISQPLPKECQECGASVEQTYENRPKGTVIFRGHGWTPKFH